MKKIDRSICITLLIFILLAVVYFLPKPVLRSVLPEFMVKYRIIGPLLTLSLAGIFLAPRQIVLAMIFSMCGDYMGAGHNFIGQMSFFAAAHVMLITFFVKRFLSLPADLQSCRCQESVPNGAQTRQGVRAKALTITAVVAIAAALIIFALTTIVPHAPAGITRIGCAIYAVLICSMFGLSMLQRQGWFATGAALFVFSDMILSWNKFVEPVEYNNLLIMVTYYSGQLILWLTAVICAKKER